MVMFKLGDIVTFIKGQNKGRLAIIAYTHHQYALVVEIDGDGLKCTDRTIDQAILAPYNYLENLTRD